jgi:predicted AlkP superfamily phosphohydrolase/phosphomutase
MRTLRLLSLALALGLTPVAAAGTRSVVVLGIDGMDPDLLQRFVAEGRMPNFERLIKQGSFSKLGTSIPPQSPVAWSNFSTGTDPGAHGIFDFIHRDPSSYEPVFSAADVIEPGRTLTVGDWVFPLAGGATRQLRRGDTFWQILDRAGVPCTVIRVPANYPPVASGARTLSGMGTPDLMGSYGTFTLFTNDEHWRGARASGGKIIRVEVTDHRACAVLTGPPNSLRKSRPDLTREFCVDLDPEHDSARITVGAETVVLRSGEWSDWVPVTFDVMPPFKHLSAICRFHLRSVTPSLQLYVSPLNIDPEHPALPISTPAHYARDLARQVGPFATLGIAEDTKALEAGVFSDADFVEQTDTLLAERSRMLDAVLAGHRGGMLFFYISTIDQSCHALWRNADTEHPAHAAADTSFAGRFLQLYEEMDEVLGRIRSRLGDDTPVIVLSDHGFAPYYRKVHLNTWLYQNGYLALVRPDEVGLHPLFGNVFWRKTRAYAVGLNGLYVNLVGRESKGIVARGPEYDALVAEIREKLLAFRDPETGEPVITEVSLAREVYHGDEVERAPDMIVGYNRGYRSSDDSALGTVTRDLVTPNLGKWTGDHCMDHRLVPGILVTNQPLAVTDPDLTDLPVTILAMYGVPAPPQMKGRALWPAHPATGGK